MQNNNLVEAKCFLCLEKPVKLLNWLSKLKDLIKAKDSEEAYKMVESAAELIIKQPYELLP